MARTSPTCSPIRRAAVRAVVVASAALLAGACEGVPVDDSRNDNRLFPARGVVRGTVSYQGPRPCSRGGHIVGNAIVAIHRAANPPPPSGLARGAVSFVAVPGDVLFANEPRSVAPELYCPPADTSVTVSAPFTIAPVEADAYVVTAFYDRGGHFWPSFSFRNQPHFGDVAGGHIDLADFAARGSEPGYLPKLLPVVVGAPGPRGELVIPPQGYVADNVPVTLAQRVLLTRPYFHPEGADEVPEPKPTEANPSGNGLYVPTLEIPQDYGIAAPPASLTTATLAALGKSFASLRLAWGVSVGEVPAAVDPAQPFGFQLSPPPPEGRGGLLVWSSGAAYRELPMIPRLWPRVAFMKLLDDPSHRSDPQGLELQGDFAKPVVLITGFALSGDDLVRTVQAMPPAAPSAGQASMRVLVEPAAYCYDWRNPALGAVLAVPRTTARSADETETGSHPTLDTAALKRAGGVREVTRGCLPKGRYGIVVSYPSGQSWSVPNESGSCAAVEGSTIAGADTGTCTASARPVLISQGTRAVIEVVAPPTPERVEYCVAHPVPAPCEQN